MNNMNTAIDQIVIHLKARLDHSPTRERVTNIRDLPYFFEGWLTLEAVCAARSRFPSCHVSVNKLFHGIKKVDLGVEIGDQLLAIEIKHVPTSSTDAKSRLLGPKDSNAVQDCIKLATTLCDAPLTRTLLMLYGPAQVYCGEPTNCTDGSGGLRDVCLRHAMEDLLSKAALSSPVAWHHHPLSVPRMHLIQVSMGTF